MSENKILEISNLHKSFNGREVLKGISLDVNEGEVVSVIGPSGSGNQHFCVVRLCWR